MSTSTPGSASSGNGRPLTINDIARLAGVSKKTVSRVINKEGAVKAETRERIEAVIASTGYSPNPQARALAFSRSFLIGLIYDNPNPDYVVRMQLGLLDGIRDTDFELAVHPIERGDPDFLPDLRRFVERQRLFGVVLTPSVSEDDRAAELLKEIGCAYVRVASVAVDTPEHSIVTHDHLGGEQAGRHLVELGHTNLAMITGLKGFRSSAERLTGFKRALDAAGVKLPDANVISASYTYESGLDAARVLLSRSNRPTAIFAGNDEMAAGVLTAARELGIKVPDELSVVGYDDFHLARRLWPDLTTVHTPTRDIGRLAALKLIGAGKTSDEEGGAEAAWVPSLVVRGSTGKRP